jgi:hypothetical protein
MTLCLYAVSGARPRRLARLRGAANEPLRTIRHGDLLAIVGETSKPLELDAPTLRAYEATIRALASAVEAILTVRFGTTLPDPGSVRAVLADRAAPLAAALTLVARREQMTLRVFGVPQKPTPPPPAANPNTGRRYLKARRAALRRTRTVPEIAWLRPVLKKYVRAERTERHSQPPLLASVHHLIPRGRAAQYVAAVERASRTPRRVRVVASGPWPPWAFAAEDVA